MKKSFNNKNQNNSEKFLDNFNNTDNNNNTMLCLCKNSNNNHSKNYSLVCYQCNKTAATITNSIHSTTTTATSTMPSLTRTLLLSLSTSSMIYNNIINKINRCSINSCSDSFNIVNSANKMNSNDKLNFKTQRTLLRYVRKILKILCLCIFMNMLICPLTAFAEQNELIKKNQTSAVNRVCQSIDVRNTPEELKSLNGCVVVEGFVQIMLIEEPQPSAFDNYTFPLLTEITEFLLLFRVNGLKTLSKLFPNLMVIRGNKLFHNYAIVMYELMDIQEVGLYSLTYIKRGGVRIERNPMLCYVNTIDWRVIARQALNDDTMIVIKQNKNENECPVCSAKRDESEKDCVVPNTQNRFCWNRENCQKICPPQCGDRACTDSGECCSETCIGKCRYGGSSTNVNSSDCYICKDLRIETSNNTFSCSKSCDNGTYEHAGRRCLTDTECRAIPKDFLMGGKSTYPFIPFRGKCILKCPDGFYENTKHDKKNCEPCNGPCEKWCKSSIITNIGAAEKFRGCTHIDGPLEIQIQSDFGINMKEELENALSSIVEIKGQLKIVRTYSLISLSFLKNLRVVTGNENADHDSKKYSLYVMDNQNLQDLFDEGHNITFMYGKYFFHLNPKLCVNKIERLKPMFNKKIEINDEDVSRTSNGDKIACNVTTINVTFPKIQSMLAIIHWDPVLIEDERALIGFSVYYIEAPYKNVTLYEVRSTCDNVGWSIVDLGEFQYNASTTHIITHLEPYTQYALYVKALTLPTESTQGAQSPINYFTTAADKPDIIQKLKASSNASSEIMISWEPPKKPRGNITNYIIKAKLIPENPELLAQRNYCDDPLKPKDSSKTTEVVVEKKPVDDKCNCENPYYLQGAPSKKPSELDVERNIDFENHLHNWVYVKRTDIASRRKREISDNTTIPNVGIVDSPNGGTAGGEEFPEQTDNVKIIVDDVTPIIENGVYTYFFKNLSASTTSFLLKGLKHYTTYSVSVKACRNQSEGEGEFCSNEVKVYQSTLPIDTADNVTNLSVKDVGNQTGSVRLSWGPPKNPNGYILTYTIKYQRLDLENSKPQPQCITEFQFRNSSNTFILDKLETGNYSVQVMVTSMAGDGRYTERYYFYIEPKGQFSVVIIVVIVVLVLIAIIACTCVYVRRKYLPVRDLKIIASVNPEYVSMQYTPDEWEVPRDNITKIRELGQGSFGMVYEGSVRDLNKNGEDQPCAIKTVNENATDRERINFLKEASVMKAFDTNHVVRLLGVVSCGQPTLVIMELMANGDLKGYLRLHRPDTESVRAGQQPPQPPTLKRILQMAIEIADGMSYLAAKKFVHRDLAARNCMVAEDLTVKIGDFGMTRDIYETDYYRKGTKGLLPVRWMAPESLKDGVFTSYSDVFSYGVVLWEMATLASQPYQGLSNDQVLRYVIDGGVMERPENCPDILYDMMRRCWQHRPNSRPSFLEIVSMLLDDANSSFRNVSFYHSDEGQELVVQLSAASVLDDVTTPLRHEEALSLDADPDDNYSYDRNDSHLVQEEDGPLPTIRSAHSPLR